MKMFIRARVVSNRVEIDLPEGHPWFKDGTCVHVKPKLYPPARFARPPKFPSKKIRHLSAPAVESPEKEGI